MDPLQTIN
jgi:CheY-like chemotaxis protein/two-component sensor histidine kinase